MKYLPLIALMLVLGMAPSAHAADQYSWRAAYIVQQGTGQVSESLSGGPFASQDACYKDSSDTPAKAGAISLQSNVGTGGFTCTCDTPIAQQGSACPGYAAPAAAPSGTCSALSPGSRFQPDTVTGGGVWICPDGTTTTVNITNTSPTGPAPAAAPSTPAPTPSAGSGQGFVPIVQIPLLSSLQPDQAGLAAFFNNLYKYLVGIAAVLAVIEIIIGGLQYSTQDSISKKGEGKDRILHAIYGLLLILSPVLVFSLINPSILNLSLNIPPLDTAPGTSYWGPPTTTTKAPTQVTQGTTGFLTPSGQLSKCDGDNCQRAQTTCTKANDPLNGINVTGNEVVCVNGSGNIDPSAGGSASCPSGETKMVQCIIVTTAALK